MAMFLRSEVQRFKNDCRGAIAVIFSVAIFALALTVGLAVDYGRTHATKVRLQNAIDAAVLAAAKRAMTSGDIASFDVNKAVNDFFAAGQPTNHNSSIISVAANAVGSNAVRGEALASVPTTFMQLTGIENIEIFVSAEANFGMGDAEIVLVLDTTGSMDGGKLDTLKGSAKDLVDSIYAQPDASSHVKVAVVPFAQYVNVGLGNRNASWMSVPLDYTETKRVCTMQRPVVSQSNCRMETRVGSNDGVPYTYQAEVCDYVYGDEVEQCNDQTYTYTWRGCAGSRDHPLNTQDGSYATRIPGLLNQWCPSEITPLTNDPDAVKGSIDAMSPSGETYIPAGLAWGWRALSHTAPFTQGADTASSSSKNVRKFLILMTDGANTRSTNFISSNVNDHWGSDVAAANNITTELCNNIKAARIEIFTIAFDVTDTAIKDILRSCASPAGAFYDAGDSTALATAFKDIAGNLGELRIAK